MILITHVDLPRETLPYCGISFTCFNGSSILVFMDIIEFSGVSDTEDRGYAGLCEDGELDSLQVLCGHRRRSEFFEGQ